MKIRAQRLNGLDGWSIYEVTDRWRYIGSTFRAFDGTGWYAYGATYETPRDAVFHLLTAYYGEDEIIDLNSPASADVWDFIDWWDAQKHPADVEFARQWEYEQAQHADYERKILIEYGEAA